MPAVLEDAQTRVSLLSGSVAFAPPKAPAMELTSADGSATMRFSGQMQFRHVYNHREGDGIDNEDFGFEHRRIRPRVAGTLFDGKIGYTVYGEFARTNAYTLVESVVTYVPDGNQRWSVGQFNAPFTREQLVSSSSRLASDNSIAHTYFTLDRTQGVEYRYREGDWGIAVMVSDGPRQRNTPYTEDADYGLTGRVERKSGADWKRHDDFQGWRGEELAWLAGLAGHVSGGETDVDGDTVRDEDYTDLRGTADFGVEGDGWNAFAAFFAQSLDAQGIDAIAVYGATLQGGVFVTDDVDVFAQYAWADDDADRGKLNVITVGTNYYIHGHVLKLTFDANYALDPITSTTVSGSRGYLADVAGEDGQFILRSQIQALF